MSTRPPINWLITDTHWNHRKVIELGRPENHCELLLQSCEELARSRELLPHDTMYHLGDVIFSRKFELEGILSRIKCRKVLLRGNHDEESALWYETHGFHYVADVIQKGATLLSHKPIRYFPDHTLYNIHGHWHTTGHRDHEAAGWYNPRRHFKLAIEETEYKPVKLSEWLTQQIQRTDTAEV